MVKTKKTKRSQSNLSRALASSNKTPTVQRNFFRMLPAVEIRRSVPGLKNHRHFAVAINLDGRKFNEIHLAKIPDLSLEKCVSWCLGVLDVHRDDIQYFLNLQKPLLSAVLNDEFEVAYKFLDTINARIGYSTWEISLRAALLSIESPERKQEYLKQLIGASENNGFLKTLVMNLVARFDDTDTLESESRFFELKIKRSFTGPLLHYLMYKLIPHRFDLSYDLEAVLNYEKDATAVDIFQAFLDFLTYNIDSDIEEVQQLCRRILDDLRQLFKFEALETLAVAFNDAPPVPIADNELAIVDLYTAGSYLEVHRAMLASSDLVTRFGLVEIWAKALSRLDGEAVEEFDLLRAIRNIVRKTEEYEKSKAVVLAYSHAMGMFPWFKELRYLLERETKYYGSELNIRLRRSSLLLSSISTPAKLQYIDGAEQQLNGSLGKSITGRLFARMRSALPDEPNDLELQGVEPRRREKFRAIWNLRRSRFDRAITLLEGLTQTASVLTKQDASRNLVEAYRSTGQVELAAKVYVEAVLANPNLTSTFDTAGLAGDCIRIIKSSASIYIPITLSLFSRLIGDKHDAPLKYSFERYLKNNGLSDPAEVTRLDGIGDVERDYFLRYVCVPEIMKLYLFFKSAQSIERSRIEICRILIGWGHKVEELQFEVKDRTRRLVLRDAVNQVQGSKIFSDANFVTGPNSQAFRTLFDRFVSLKGQDFSSSDDVVVLTKMIGVFQKKEELLSTLYAIHIPDLALNERNSTFLRLVKLVRDEFAFGERGLNVYLSTRIRHGYFPNTVRKPLRDNSLLATRISDTSGYKTSKDLREIFLLQAREASIVEQALVEFSTKFNELVDEVNDKWLRIFTVDSDISGLAQQGKMDGSRFNYSVSAIEAYYLQGQLSDTAEFADFVAMATRWLWARTEASLTSIREQISGEMRRRALELLENFSKGLIQRVGMENLGDLPNAIARARSGLLQVFDTIPSWFTRAATSSVPRFDLDIPIQIAKIAADVDVDFVDETGISWKGSALTPFVDIFYILFENCSSKSKLKKDELFIKAQAVRVQDTVRISVTNCCEEVESVDEANGRLESYREAIAANELVMDKVQREGGSGFVKLRRSLEKDLGFGKNIQLGYSTPADFEVSISIPLTSASPLIDDENTSG